MKIVAVTYGNEDAEQVCRDIEAIRTLDMTDSITGINLLGDQLSQKLKESYDIMLIKTESGKRPGLMREIKASEAQLLITYDLAGFELPTLTDGLAYNLVDMRQFHIVTDYQRVERLQESQPVSLNMFFIDRKRIGA